MQMFAVLLDVGTRVPLLRGPMEERDAACREWLKVPRNVS